MRRYGIYNTFRKCFQFRISEETPELAKQKLATIIGDDAANKDKFEARIIPKKGVEQHANNSETTK